MSPTFWGPTRSATCSLCGWSHRVHLQPNPLSRQLRCFRCGKLGLQLGQRVMPGERVQVDPQAYQTASPARNDCVVVRLANSTMQVKRVIGLPGDLVAIDSAGQLWVNGQRFDEPLEMAWSRAIEVYQLENLNGIRPRWKSAFAAGPAAKREWLFQESEFHCQLGDSPTPWLTYQHLNVDNLLRPGPIQDDNPANAALTRVTLPVNELRLRLSIHVPQPAGLEVAFATPAGLILGRLPLAAGQQQVLLLTRHNQLWQCPPVNENSPPQTHPQSPLNITLPVVEVAQLRVDNLVSPAHPVAFRVTGIADLNGGQVKIGQLWLGRAARYDPPVAWRGRWQHGVRAGNDRYLVFGDNPPNSTDCRTALEGVSRAQIQARVLQVKRPAG